MGSWGEWHASTNDLREPENARRIIEKWLEVLPASRCVQVRTPGIKQMLTGAGEAIKEGEAFFGGVGCAGGASQRLFFSDV